LFFFFQAEDGIRDRTVTGVQTCALPISSSEDSRPWRSCAATEDSQCAPRRWTPPKPVRQRPVRPAHSLTHDCLRPRLAEPARSLAASGGGHCLDRIVILFHLAR